MVASCRILEMAGSGIISSRVAWDLQSGSVGLDDHRKTAVGPPSGGCITPFKAADPRILSVPDKGVILSTDEGHNKETRRHQPPKLARHHHAQLQVFSHRFKVL